MRAGGKTWARTGLRYGGALLASWAVLCVEALTALVVWVTVSLRYEPPPGNYAVGGIFYLIAVPLAGALVTGTVVLAAVRLSRWSAHRRLRRETWRWLAATTLLVVTAVVVAFGVVLPLPVGESPAWAGVGWTWLGSAAAVLPAALVARAALNERWVATGASTGGAVALLVATVVTGVALYATDVLTAWEAPQLTGAELAGTWSDGDGGVLTLTADGTLTAKGVAEYDSAERTGRCDGTGTWRDAGKSGDLQALDLSIPGCRLGDWTVAGTRDEPTVHVWTGGYTGEWYILHRDR
ncbi:hypothetical protein SRB5_45020 [Streptomyces sp. RB5]|uniref:Uncharacterized protein n=1 Tax=Streptomyces smaragdinus TaxID=2585196 RepID=A0A7K0CLH3_9ACTN|nr:hypothetical protein [Streptomyces smaragdinus]MQY14338.1 hypothetical protein [Streptomyces smaragdinus]